MYPNSYIFLTEELNLVWIFDMSYYWKLLDLSQDEKYSRVRNTHIPTFIDFWFFFPRATILLRTWKAMFILFVKFSRVYV